MNRFVDHMPAVYGHLYSGDEMAEHAAIASRRGERLVHAEMWRSKKGPVLCVVAVDRPGLLALMTDALSAQGMAIVSARAFCREIDKEAVDFLELRALGDKSDATVPLDDDGLATFTQYLGDLIADDLAQQADAVHMSRVPPGPPTRVYFERQMPAEGRYLLVIDAPDSNGLLHAVSAALFDKGMRIMACEIRTVGGQARDRFEVESTSGLALGEAALCDVQIAVLDALPSRL
jgi:UTP:GlnB (protein PII) uridylyltransferase